MSPRSSPPQQYINVNILLPLKSHVLPLGPCCLALVEQELHEENAPKVHARCLYFHRHGGRAAVHIVAQHAIVHSTRAKTSEGGLHTPEVFPQKRACFDGNIISFGKATAICTGTMYQKLPSRHALKGYTTSPSHPIPSNCPENVAYANCTMRNSQTPPKRVRFTPFPVSMVSKTFWTLFLLIFSLPFLDFLLVCSEERLVGFGGSIPHMSKTKLLKCNWRSARTGDSTRLP